MNPKVFDSHVQAVVAELPQIVREFMRSTPLLVEDSPPSVVLQRLKIRNPAHLYGLYTVGSENTVTIYRLSLLGKGLDDAGLRIQIRKTILHEYGHHVGMTEGELRKLGFG